MAITRTWCPLCGWTMAYTVTPPAIPVEGQEQAPAVAREAECTCAAKRWPACPVHTFAAPPAEQAPEPLCGLSWNGHNITGDEQSIAAAKDAIHAAATVPALKERIRSAEAAEQAPDLPMGDPHPCDVSPAEREQAPDVVKAARAVVAAKGARTEALHRGCDESERTRLTLALDDACARLAVALEATAKGASR